MFPAQSTNNHFDIVRSTAMNYKIYLITMDKTIQFYHILNQGVWDMSKLTNIEYTWDAPQIRNVDKQIETIKNVSKSGADAIILAAIDPVKVSSAVGDAKALGIKVIYVDSPANEAGIVTLATDNYSAGVSAGESMLRELSNQGIQSGSIGIVSASPTTSTTMSREKGFRASLKEDDRFHVLDTKYSNNNKVLAHWSARSFLSDNPDLAGLFATDEINTTAVGDTLSHTPQQVIGVGFDLTERIQELINQGYLKAVMAQNPYTMGYLGMAETIAALNGYSTGPEFLNTGITVRTKYFHS